MNIQLIAPIAQRRFSVQEYHQIAELGIDLKHYPLGVRN